MTEYRRARTPGATYFLTVNCAERKGNSILTDNIDTLRNAFRKVKNNHPFEINAIVILPEHLHCIWTLPGGDADFASRWGLIKSNFSRSIANTERRSDSRVKRGARGVWQRRYWEHLIRDEDEYCRHVDYIHWNPVKHGWAERVKDWPYSSFHQHVNLGAYPLHWAGEIDESLGYGE